MLSPLCWREASLRSPGTRGPPGVAISVAGFLEPQHSPLPSVRLTLNMAARTQLEAGRMV